MASACPSCCTACADLPTCSSSKTPDLSPFAPDNLFPIGTFTIGVLGPESKQALCDHSHAGDGWHSFKGKALLGHLSNTEDGNLCQDIDFLSKYHFLRATFCVYQGTSIIVRVYLIPYDLGNVKGILRVRKPKILRPARRLLKELLPRISKDPEQWKGNGSSSNTSPSMVEQDSRTLAEIYGDLDSPHPIIGPPYEDIARRLLDFDDDLQGFGMKSTLYKYQRRSISAMIQRELDSRDMPDPLYVACIALNGKPYYLQPGTMEVLCDPPMVAPSKSGILCEELGTGKTVMILGLILATVSQLSAPEPSIMDNRPVLTPLALRHFPSNDFETARNRLSGESKKEERSALRVPSLVELLLHRSRVAPDINIPDTTTPHGSSLYQRKQRLAEHIELLPLGDLLHANVPFYHHYHGEPVNHERNQRIRSNAAPRVVYLSSATLIIVPPNLLSQWDREIQKHCEYPLRVLIMRAKTPTPVAQSLATDFDIILTTYTRFATEHNLRDVSKLHFWKTCTCPEFNGSRVPDCHCEVPKVSPLLQVRWKRVVIDEGHVSATLSTVLTPFMRLLSVERRWIVTGTPTTNLLGLSFGKKSNDNQSQQEEDDTYIEDVSADLDSVEAHASQTTTSSRNSSCPPSGDTPEARIWTKSDREDLYKLGNMITHFVAAPQFLADLTLFQTHVTDPLLDKQGPRYGSIRVLKQVMEMVMIRHQIEDVEEDVVLPPVKKESIFLDLDPYAVKSYNALQATIAINAIDSQRTDQDYMFHPQNADALQVTMKNMSQLMFWSSDESLYNVDQLLRDTEIHISTAIERGMPQEDIDLLRDAFKHVRIAAEDHVWRKMQNDAEIPYRVHQMEPRVFNAWTRTPNLAPQNDPLIVGFMHVDRLLELRNLVSARPRISEERLVHWGEAVATQDRALKRIGTQSTKSHKADHRKSARRRDEANSSLKVTNATKKACARETLDEIREELNKSMEKLKFLENKEDGSPISFSHLSLPGIEDGPSPLLASSPMAPARIGSSVSSKLGYIMNEVIQHAAKEKFLIFSDSPLTLAYVAEALDLLQVKYLRFTTQITPQHREQLVLTYETSETYRVFLMELKHGARGLNLISASRVIFCEPIWRADIESQAIKRAHRIGQTRSISVKILAIRGTAEENMVARRDLLKHSEGKIPKITEEAGMRHYIANPKFINYPPIIIPIVDIPLLNIPPSTDNTLPEAQEVRISPPKRIRVEEPIPIEDLPPPKKRTVRFV